MTLDIATDPATIITVAGLQLLPPSLPLLLLLHLAFNNCTVNHKHIAIEWLHYTCPLQCY